MLEYDDVYIELLEMCPCNNKMELTRREGELIRANDTCVNKIIPGRTRKQYREDNAEAIKAKKSQFYQDNADKIKEQKKQYRQSNTDKIKAHYNQKRDCDCGGKYTEANKARHLKTKKHQKYLETL